MAGRGMDSGLSESLIPEGKGGVVGTLFRQLSRTRELPGVDDGELQRTLGPVELTLMGIGACVGAGIFVLTGVQARIAGPSVVLSFALAAATSVFNGLGFAELASRLPISGSSYLYTYCIFGELPALLVVCNLLVDYHLGAALSARSLMGYVAESFGALMIPESPCLKGCAPVSGAPWLSFSFGAPLILLALAFIVSGGAKETATVNAFMTALKIGIVVLVIGAGAQFVSVDRWLPFVPHGMDATLQASATLNYAFIGYDVVANSAEESINPQRDIAVAIMGTVTICAGLYIAMTLVICGMQDSDAIDAEAPISSAFAVRRIWWATAVINVGASVGLFTTLLAGIYAQSRLYFALARDRLIPSAFHNPSVCAWWCGAVAAVLALAVDVEFLSTFLNIGVLFSYSLTAMGVLFINVCSRRRFRKPIAGVCALTFASVFLPAPLSWASWAALIALVCWIAKFQSFNCCPSGTFQCPGQPVTPLIALICNIYLACHLSWHAWVRFAAVGVVVVSVFSTMVLMGRSGTKERRQSICKTVKETTQAHGTNAGVCRQNSPR